jgi:cytochrome P450
MNDITKLGADYFKDPHPLNERLRTEGPIAQVEMPTGFSAWMVTGYDDVRAVLSDERLTKDWRKLVPAPSAPSEAAPLNDLSVNMLNMDPPDHSRLRKLVSRGFTARRVENLRPRVEAITSALLDDLAAHDGDEVDLVESFAFPMPITVICELLGVPESDRDKFRAWSETFLSSVATAKEERTAASEVMAYFSALVAARRADPGSSDDLLSALLHPQEDGDSLTENELITLVILLLNAGHETTLSLIALGMLTLLRDPATHARLHADRSLLPAAVEELLRYTSPVNHATLRFTTEPTTIAGTDIPAEQIVIASLSSANRDQSRFGSPAVFDVERDTTGHLAFGHGKHFCLGAPLARLEAEVAFAGLLDRFPAMTLAAAESDLRWRPSTFMRSPETLPVRLRG